MSTMKLTLLTDLYELTMMQGYFKNHTNETVIFDAFTGKIPPETDLPLRLVLTRLLITLRI